MKTDEIKKYLSKPIDRFNLEVELEQHAFMFMEATKDLADLRMDVALMKNNLETTAADLDLKIRQEYEKVGKKTTETTIAAEVKTQKQYLDAFDQHLKTKRDYDELDMLREVFMARESAIKGLISLYGAQYWSLAGAEKIVGTAALDLKLPEAGASNSKFKQRSKEG